MHKILSSIWEINSIITKYSFGILAICLNNKKIQHIRLQTHRTVLD